MIAAMTMSVFSSPIPSGMASRKNNVKLFIGLLSQHEEHFRQVRDRLIEKFGPIDLASDIMDFDQTDYYEKEFGKGLKRMFYSFAQTRPIENIHKVKVITCEIERGMSVNKKRTVNIDPGYITMAKLVLLTTKDYSHRIYIGNGIFAEVTLTYKNNEFAPWECTYPDYKRKDYLKYFRRVRGVYAGQIKATGKRA